MHERTLKLYKVMWVYSVSKELNYYCYNCYMYNMKITFQMEYNHAIIASHYCQYQQISVRARQITLSWLANNGAMGKA